MFNLRFYDDPGAVDPGLLSVVFFELRVGGGGHGTARCGQISSFLSSRNILRKAGQKKRENQLSPRISFLPVELSVHAAVFEVMLETTRYSSS